MPDTKNPLLTIGKVSRLTGVSIPVLRNWSDRYGLSQPARSNGGFRLYSSEDVERILSLKGLMGRTHATQVPSVPGKSSTQLPDQNLRGRQVELDFDRDSSVNRLRLLYQTATTLTRQLDPDMVIEQILAQACHIFGGTASALLLFEDAPTAGHATPRKFTLGTLTMRLSPLDDEILAEVQRTEGTCFFSDAGSWVGQGLGPENSKGGLIAIPLMYSRRLLAVLYSVGITAPLLSAEEAAMATTFAQIAACALESAILTRHSDEIVDERRSLLSTDEDLIALVDYEGVITYAGHKTARLLGYDPADLQGKPFSEIVAGKARRRSWRPGGRMENGEPQAREIELLAKDGSLIAAEVRAIIRPQQQGRFGFAVRDVSARRRLELELAFAEKRGAVLDKIAAAISESIDLDEVLQLSVDAVVRLTDKENTIISLVDEQRGELVIRAHCNATEDVIQAFRRIKLGEAISGRVAVTGEPILSVDIGSDPRTFMDRHKNHSFLGVPLTSNNKVLGTLMITSRQFQRISPDEVQLFAAIGRLIGRAVERARMYDRSMRGYHDRLALMHDELLLMTNVRVQERQRIAEELRHYMQGAHEVSRSSSRDLSRVLNALESLEAELSAPLDDASLPVLLKEGLDWRSALDPAGRAMSLAWDSWPEDVPCEVTCQLYLLVNQLLSMAARIAPNAALVVSLVHDGESIGLQLAAGSPVDYSVTTPSAPDWSSIDLTEAQRTVGVLQGRIAVQTEDGIQRVVVIIPRYWDRVTRLKPVTALVVNDQPLYGQAMAALLDSQEPIQVIGVAHNSQEAVQLARRLAPDVVIIDVSPPAMRGIDVTRALRIAHPTSRLLVLTPDLGHGVVEALLAGATGFVPKDSPPVEVLRAVHSLLDGEPVLTPDLAQRALGVFSPTDGRTSVVGDGQRLTAREIEILRLIAAGKSSKEICRLLPIADKTLRRHVSNMYQKLQIFDRAQLVLYAARKGLVDISDSAAGLVRRPLPADTDKTP